MATKNFLFIEDRRKKTTLVCFDDIEYINEPESPLNLPIINGTNIGLRSGNTIFIELELDKVLDDVVKFGKLLGGRDLRRE